MRQILSVIMASAMLLPVFIGLRAAEVTIGAGNENARFPIDFHYKNSLYECIYMADELDFVSGTITSIALYNNFIDSLSNGATKVYLGSTNRSDLNSGWIPATGLTLVFDGEVTYPAGENVINIPLQIPYHHTPGNLVMMVHRPMDDQYYSASDFFRCQTIGNNRARYAMSDYTIYDPHNPTDGILTGQLPQITIFYTPAQIENDLSALSITGSRSPTVGIASVYTVRIKNNGTAPQDTYTVKLMGPNDEELASVAGPAITGQQVLEVDIPWVPSTAGSFSIHGKVEMAGDEFEGNNHTQALNLSVNPAGVFTVLVGEGYRGLRMPMDFNFKNSLYETLFYPDEMGEFRGQITGLKFNTNFLSTLEDKECKVWLGTTTQGDLGGGWIPATQLTQVFDGSLDFEAGPGQSVTITFNGPYVYQNGQNLVMMVNRPMDTDFYSPADLFLGQAGTLNRARNAFHNTDICDPDNPPVGTLTQFFPQTTFLVIPDGVGQICGTVRDVDNRPLSGVAVSLNGNAYQTITDDDGQFQLVNILPDTYTMSCNAHGYYEHTQTVVVEEKDDLTINVTMQILPQVSVTGTILASDTGTGISGTLIKLSGFEPYSVTTDAVGAFTIPNVYAGHTYGYNISADGYSSENGQISVGATNYDMGEITLNEIAYTPMEVVAEPNSASDAVKITWLAPDPTPLEIFESFEVGTFPPGDWTQTIANNGPPNALGIYPTWCRVGAVTITGDVITPTDGGFQAGLHWDYNHQDEWLITRTFNCPPSAYLSFDSYVFLGSEYGDHYYVKLSTDNGVTWAVLWDASTQTGGWNRYSSPIFVDLSAYSGNQVKIAFHAQDPSDNTGLKYNWFIDNVYIGNSADAVRLKHGDFTSRTARNETRALTGYMVYRLQPDQEQDEDAWTAVTDSPTAELEVCDSGWATLDNGDYRWAVKAVYSNGVTSLPSFSRILNRFVKTGMIIGTVRNTNAIPIADATVTNGTVSATTNSMGVYTIVVPVGFHSVTASAEGYSPRTVDEVLVDYDLATTVNFVLNSTTNDDNLLPVVATALNGNYPNPFNPETTISYSVKQPGRVKLEVYNIKGQLVRTLIDEEQATGHYKLAFKAGDDSGRSIASGVYMLKMVAPGYRKTSKMILMQ